VTGPLERLPVAAGTLAECPYWDAVAAGLYWVDIPAGQVHFLDESGGQRSWEAGQPAGAVARRAGGGLVLAVRDGFVTMDTATGQTSALAPVELNLPGNRMNDGACDRAGRFFAGTKAEDDAPGAGALYRLDPDHVVTLVVADVTISNGIGWSPDGSRMYYVDSPAKRIDVFDYDPATGEATGRRVLADLSGYSGVPDGLTVDLDGYVWVAMFGGGVLRRFAPSGDQDAVVSLPVTYPTSVAFGGADLSDLYVTTSRRDLSPSEAEAEPLAGRLLTLRPGPAGLPSTHTHAVIPA